MLRVVLLFRFDTEDANYTIQQVLTSFLRPKEVFTGFRTRGSTTWPTSRLMCGTDGLNVVLEKSYSWRVQAEVTGCLVCVEKPRQLDCSTWPFRSV